MITSGLDIRQSSSHLHLIIFSSSVAAFSSLLIKQGKSKLGRDSIDHNARDKYGSTPFFLAFYFCRTASERSKNLATE